MRKCNKCNLKEGVHRWSRWWLCDKCHEEWTKETQSQDTDPAINIAKETELYEGGWYMNGDGEVYLIGDKYDPEEVLNHEYMHHLLNVLISPQTSFNYDNIAEKHIDPYHSLR